MKPIGRPPITNRVAAALVAGAAVGAGAALGLASAFGSSPRTAAPVTVPSAQPAALDAAGLSPSELYAKSSPGVVDIGVTGTTDGYGPFGSQQTQGEGSGFVLDAKGDIVTNFHVVDGAGSILVNFEDGAQAKATVVGTDPATDLAVVHVNVSADRLHPLPLGSSASVQPGEAVVAIGSPFGLADSITAGIVSAVDRSITSPNGSTIAGAIQTDAAINKGNSGGPLIDSAGNVIGVNAQIDSSSGGSNGVGFAIPIDTVKQVTSQLLAGGKAEHAFLGVRITSATRPPGSRVDNVVAGSPAAKSGLKIGDVIVSVDGRRAAGAEQLQALIAAHRPGDTVTLVVSNGGKVRTVEATLADRTS